MTIKINEKENFAQVYLYGEVMNEAPRDWWTDEKLEGDFIDVETLKSELPKLENKEKIEVHINSSGGVYYAGLTIYNLLKSLNCQIDVIVDGIAASAASIIAMAGNLKMCPGSVLMIHPAKCLLLGYYGQDELDLVLKSLDATMKSAIDIYASKNKTKTVDEIKDLLNQSTWFVAEEAVNEGFADEVIEHEKAEMQLTSDAVIINGIKHNLHNFSEDFTSRLDKAKSINTKMTIHGNIKNYFKNYINNIKTSIQSETQEKKGEEKMDLNELKEKFPELMNEFKESVLKEEREREYRLCEDYLKDLHFDNIAAKTNDIQTESAQDIDINPLEKEIKDEIVEMSKVMLQVKKGE